MLIEIKGKFSITDFHKVIDVLSTYFHGHGVEEFVEINIRLKPFSKAIQSYRHLFLMKQEKK